MIKLLWVFLLQLMIKTIIVSCLLNGNGKLYYPRGNLLPSSKKRQSNTGKQYTTTRHMVYILSKPTVKGTRVLNLSVLHVGRMSLRPEGSNLIWLFRGWLGSVRMRWAFSLTLTWAVDKTLRFTPATLQHILTMASSLFLFRRIRDPNQQIQEKVQTDSI